MILTQMVQMPEVACPDAANAAAAREWRKNGLDARAHARQSARVTYAGKRRRSPFAGGMQAHAQASQDRFEAVQPITETPAPTHTRQARGEFAAALALLARVPDNIKAREDRHVVQRSAERVAPGNPGVGVRIHGQK